MKNILSFILSLFKKKQAPIQPSFTPTQEIVIADTLLIQSAAIGTTNQRFGTWLTTGDLTQAKLDTFPRDILRGVRLRYGSIDINPTNGIYNYSNFDKTVSLCVTNKLSLGFQLWRNPYDQNPSFWGNTPYNVPIVLTDDANLNKYYFYLDTNFQALCDLLTNSMAKHLSELTPDQKKTILFWLASFGVTGDYGSYKGQPKDVKYAIKDTVWDAYVDKNANQVIAINKTLNPSLQIAMNPSNAGTKWDHLISLGITALKVGDFGHGYGGNGSGTFARRTLDAIKANPAMLFFSESEGIQQDPTWNDANWMAICGEAITADVGILSIASVNNVTAIGCLLYNKYARIEDKGLWMARDVLDYADTTRFKTDKYKELIDPTRLQQYNKQVQRVNADTTLGDAAKKEKLSNLLAEYINPERVTIIQNEYAIQGYQFVTGNSYLNDGGVDLIRGCYNNGHLTLVTPDLFIGVPRLEVGNQAYWRYWGRPVPFKNWYFASDIPQKTTHTISITYYDVGTRWQMTLQYNNGTSDTITPFLRSTQTAQVVTQKFVVNCKIGGLNGNTFAILFQGSPYIKMIEIE